MQQKIEGQKVWIEQQRETIKELTEKINDNEPKTVIIKVLDLMEGSDKEAFYIEEELYSRDIDVLTKIFKTIEYKAAFPIELFIKQDKELK